MVPTLFKHIKCTQWKKIVQKVGYVKNKVLHYEKDVSNNEASHNSDKTILLVQ